MQNQKFARRRGAWRVVERAEVSLEQHEQMRGL
jgi:hypothetical protein